ncbi:MAG: 50S ribosomal protein L29 [Deltaproteobacteria bacterium]|nr:MAG: 50S ribosomal protein L29 [Deltaproteobacteria bacterium]
MKTDELRKLSGEEIAEQERKLRSELSSLSFKHRIRPLEDTSSLRKIRKDIARIRTIINEKSN